MATPNQSERIDDEEILFTTMMLMFGEPPRLPKSYVFDDKLRVVHELKSYALQVRDMMAELGHNPHQGLYTSYIWWCDHEWKSHRDKPQPNSKCPAQARDFRSFL